MQLQYLRTQHHSSGMSMFGQPLTARPLSARAAVARGCRVVAMAGTGRFFVGGNWKCNGSKASVEQLVADLNKGSFPAAVEVVVAPTFVHLGYVKANIKPDYAVAAQNCWVQKAGAFTGEVSPEMLADLSIPWVILGHSERRALCGETNEVVGAKVRNALEEGVKVIACVGETLTQRESGEMFNVLDGQLEGIAANVDDWSKVIIAYEPVWAIGTGVVATPAQAQEVHAYLRSWLTNKIGGATASGVRLLYGGSVNDGNCEELARQEDVDGFLVGGASLKGDSFIKICNSASALIGSA